MKFETPTPIQAQAIPVALAGGDLIGCAQTGTGKTAAFGIPMLTQLLAHPDQDALILLPTRELAAQVTGVLEQIGQYLPDLRIAMLIGGVAMKPQLKALARKPRVIVATPGRLLDHLRSRAAKLDRVSVLVLDEADRMLDLGFAPQLQAILRFLPRDRQTMLFSATVPPDIERLARDYLRNPKRVQVGQASQVVPQIEQKILEVSGGEKNAVLLEELNARQGTVLVFARTQHRTDRVARYLESYGIEVARIHGGRSQGQRNRALDGFRDGTFRVLVATDIAARGIDIDHVAHVINYDLPNVPEDYVHRIGRTGRAGREGQAISLISHEERPLWRDIQKLIGSKGGAQVERQAARPDDGTPRPQRKPQPEQRQPQGQRQSQGQRQPQGQRQSQGPRQPEPPRSPRGGGGGGHAQSQRSSERGGERNSEGGGERGHGRGDHRGDRSQQGQRNGKGQGGNRDGGGQGGNRDGGKAKVFISPRTRVEIVR